MNSRWFGHASLIATEASYAHRDDRADLQQPERIVFAQACASAGGRQPNTSQRVHEQ